MSDPLREKLIRLAHAQPELREDLLPILKQAGTFRSAGVDLSAWGRLRPGDVISVSTSRFADPALVVQYWGDDNTMPPYDKGMMVARKVSQSETYWIFKAGGGLVIESTRTNKPEKVKSLESTGEKSSVSHRQATAAQSVENAEDAKATGTTKTGKLKQFHPGAVPRDMEEPERGQYLDKMVEGAVLGALKEAGRCLASVEDIGLFLDPETDNQFMPKAKSVHDAVKNLEHTMKLLKSIVRLRRRP